MSSGDWKDLYNAASVGDLERVVYQVKENNVDPDYVHPEILSTVLFAATQGQHEEVVKFLVEHGADPDKVSYLEQKSPRQLAKKLKLNYFAPKSSLLKRFFRL